MPANLNPASNSNRSESRDVLLIAAWFGILTGLLEGALLLIFQHLGAVNWNVSFVGVSVEIVWIAAAFDLLLFGVVAFAVCCAGRLFSKIPLQPVAVFLFVTLSCLDLIWISGRVGGRAAIVLSLGIASVFLRYFQRNGAALMRLWLKTSRWVVLAGLLVAASIQGGLWLHEQWSIHNLPAAAIGLPNVIIVVIDTLRADHVSAYGYRRNTTPGIDQIAKEGTLFESAFAPSSWTLPSHVSLLTGRYPHEHHVESTTTFLDGKFETLGEALSRLGYRTGAFSANTALFARHYGFGRGFLHFEDYFSSLPDMAVRTVYGRNIYKLVLRRLGVREVPGRKRAPETTRETLRWIRTRSDHPYFAVVNYFDVHDPYLPPAPYDRKFSISGPRADPLDSTSVRTVKLTPERVQPEIDGYDGAISYVDENVARLINGVRGTNTIVIITSDHGESLGDHGLMFHNNGLYRSVIQVPLIVWWPGHVPAGTRVQTPVSIASTPATVMQMVGVTSQNSFPGPSLAQFWGSGPAITDSPVLSELAQQFFENKLNPASAGWLKCLVTSRWHYILHEKFGPELYDWHADPQETHNMATTKDGEQLVQQFGTELRSLVAAETPSSKMTASQTRSGSIR